MEISERVLAQLAILSSHLAFVNPVELSQKSQAIEPWSTSAAITPSPQGSLKGTLTIVDKRTGKKYKVPILDDGTDKAVEFKKIATRKEDKGIKLYDPLRFRISMVTKGFCVIVVTRLRKWLRVVLSLRLHIF